MQRIATANLQRQALFQLRRATGANIAPIGARSFQYSVEKEPHHVFKSSAEIIDEKYIERVLAESKELAKDESVIKDILSKAKDRALLKNVEGKVEHEYVQGLTVEEAAILLNMDSSNKTLMKSLLDTALSIKEMIYGNRIVLFAPLYISNYCINHCTYCGFRAPNHESPRAILTKEALIEEVKALERQGHRRLLLLTGESPKYTFDQFLDAVKTVSQVRTEPCGNIRRINVEIPAISVSDFRRLKETDCVGTYTLFQESYHRETYRRTHPKGPKADYDYRVQTFDRAQTGGIDDVGMGVLFGLHDYKFEVLAILQHAQHLDRTYGAGPHTVSIPRMQPAEGAPDSINVPHPVSDPDFMKMVAIIRCAVPYTGMILSTRESAEMRRAMLHLGISQMSAGSKTDVGSYSGFLAKSDPHHNQNKRKQVKETAPEHEHVSLGQFDTQDHRPLDEVVQDLLHMGYVPSFCTACYRKGRTGEAFMKIAKTGNIQNFCHPNALLTLEEFLLDYASPKTKEIGAEVLKRESENIPSERARQSFAKKLEKIDSGARDLYF